MNKIFWPKNILERKRVKSLLSSKNGWYDLETCKEQLIKERNRSSRSGAPISCIIIDLSVYSDDNYLITEKEYGDFLAILISLITKNSRDYDIKCIKNIFQIEIYLVETDIKGAKSFIENISKKSYDFFLGAKNLIKLIRSMNIFSHTFDKDNLYESFKGNPIIQEIDNKIQKNENNRDYSRRKIEYRKSDLEIDWNMVSSSNGVLALGSWDSINIFHPLHKESIYLFFKRLLDIIGSISGLVLFLPIMVVIALAIKFTSKGPVFFKQKRVGLHGREFDFLKFRSMTSDNDDSIHQEYVKKLIEGKEDEINEGDEKNPVFKISNDPRITSIGHIIRATSLDELPQFLNVIKGDMSLVGPRPPIPYELESYQPWHLRRVLEVQPGITGLWQVYGRSKTTFDEMVRMDLQYISHRNILLDIKLLLKTLTVIFNSDGAY